MSKPIDWETEIIYRGRPLSDYANHIREECARAVESWSVPWQMVPSIAELAAAIRALKDDKC